jgi:GT2 family glycosyltransferase
MPGISIIVPLYNKLPFMRRALDSIAAQTYSDFEVIIVDDGSTDGGAEVAASYPDSRFRVVRQENSGPGAARNRGLADVCGALVAFLDADDEWLPEYLSRAAEELERCGPDVAALASAWFEYPDGGLTENMWRARGLRDGPYRTNPDTRPELLVHMLALMSPCTTLARAEVLRKWGGFYARNRCIYAEDAFLWLKILLNETVAFRLQPAVNVHAEAGSLSRNLRGPRPLEPFLEDPAAIEAACPDELRPLLARFYTIRAFKTACVWGYWGEWRKARALRARFRTPQDYALLYYSSSLLYSTPLGAVMGGLWRKMRA